MLNFLTSFPSYLLGLFALAVPIIIHLFSKSKGRPVAVGTLKFFQQVKPVKMKQVKLVEIFLLVLRLLMLICAVLLVAQLWWLDNDSGSNEEFYLISVNWLNQSSMEEKRELATKLTENNAYILNSKLSSSNLSSISPDKILTWETSKGSDLKLKNKPLWSAINTAHFKLAKEATFHIYTDNLASNFIGKPVKISQPIQWHILSINNDQLSNIKTSPLHITVVADADREHSVLRIKQALALLKTELIPKLSFDVIETQQVNNLDNPINDIAVSNAKHADWLFYLSSNEKSLLLRDAINNGVNVFFDAKALEKQHRNTIVPSENEMLLDDFLLHKSGSNIVIESLFLETELLDGRELEPKLIEAVNNRLHTTSLWRTEKGNIVLEKHEIDIENNIQLIYQFHSRFEDDWNSLTEQPQFIRVLLSLLLQESSALKQMPNEYNKLSLAQIQAFDTAENSFSKPKSKINQYLSLINYEEQLLTQWLMILLMLFWCGERLLSERSPTERQSSSNNDSIKESSSFTKSETT